jgi:hypothetical protein
MTLNPIFDGRSDDGAVSTGLGIHLHIHHSRWQPHEQWVLGVLQPNRNRNRLFIIRLNSLHSLENLGGCRRLWYNLVCETKRKP